MSLILLYTFCLGLGILVGLFYGPLKRLLLHLSRRDNNNNRLALVPVAPSAMPPPRPSFDPLEASSWHKGIRPHIRFLARSVHIPPDLDEGSMPVELHSQLLVLAMLQNLFRTGQLQRQNIAADQSDSDIDIDIVRIENQERR